MKRVLWVVILTAALVAVALGFGRWQVERLNRTVEIVYDLPGLLELASAAQIPIEELFSDLQRAGVATVAVQPVSIGQLFLFGEPLPPSVASELPTDMDKLGRLLSSPAIFRADDFALLDSNGLKSAPKLNAVSWDVEPVWATAHPELLILSGSGEFRPEGVQDFHGRLALVEFHTPAVAHLEDAVGRMVRLHGISEGEMKILPTKRILTRYLRAVRERNIRILYVRPFLEGENTWKRSLDLLANLQVMLEDGGYRLGQAEPFSPWEPAFLWKFLVSAGIWAGAVLYGQGLFPKQSRLVGALGFMGWIISAGIALRWPVFAAQGTALLAAVVFPCLALRVAGRTKPRQGYWLAAGVSLLGALLIIGTLTGPHYLLKIREFRGVKLMHVLPVFVVVFTLIRPLRSWLNKDVPVKYLLLAGLVGMLGILYILRTGNFGLPVPAWEIKIREGLEQLLLTRPRTKEFLVGHPALFLALQSKHPARSWWLPVAVVGQVSLINTFTHIHSPLSISLLRTAYGLVMGYFFGWLFGLVLRRGKRWLA